MIEMKRSLPPNEVLLDICSPLSKVDLVPLQLTSHRFNILVEANRHLLSQHVVGHYLDFSLKIPLAKTDNCSNDIVFNAFPFRFATNIERS